jgi:hypothetical protein
MKRTDAILYLRRYYAPSIPGEYAASENLAAEFLSSEIGKAAVATFQKDFGEALKLDGELGEKTLRAMATPRCGCTAEMMRTENARLQAWPKRDWKADPLTYRFVKYVSGIDELTIRGLAKQGAELWMEACGIWIREAKAGEKEDVTISVGQGRRDNFDGPSGTLAWAEVAGRLMMFDGGENWTVDGNGIGWLEVFDHEFGHTLGILHQPDGNLLAPFYKRGLYKPQAGDIAEAQARYGKPLPKDEPPVDPKPPETGTLWKLDTDTERRKVFTRA